MEVIGDVVWVVTSSEVLRYVDTGTKLELTASIAQPWGMPESLRATENDVAVANASTLKLYTFDGSQGSFPACTFQLGGGRFGRTAAPCQTLEGIVVGFEPQAVWAAIKHVLGSRIRAIAPSP